MNITCRQCNAKIILPPNRVLTVVHSDGWIQTYAEKGTQAHFAIMPSVASIENEVLAEQVMEAALPKDFADLYWPLNLRTMILAEKVTPYDIAKRRNDLELLEKLERIEKAKQNNTTEARRCVV